MAIKPLEINSKILKLMKPVTSADYTEKTVLTNSSWEYVELWLKRKNSDKSKQALFYWLQAKNFFNASECLPIESRPLTAYYCCLNAAKALLAIRGTNSIDFDKLSHGITSDRRQWKSNNIKQAKVLFLGSGVLYELSKYFGEEACKKEYNVYDLLYNIPCIHRTFAITYNCTELFIPIQETIFMIDSKIKKGWIQCKVDERYSNGNSLRYLPKSYEKVTYDRKEKSVLLRGKRRFDWDKHIDIKLREKKLSTFHGKIRKNLHYIVGDMRLWYIKKGYTKQCTSS